MRNKWVVSVLLLLLIFSLTLNGCASNTDSSSTPGEPAEGETPAETSEFADMITIGRLTDPSMLEPNQPDVGISEVNIILQMMEGLVTNAEDGSGKIVPLLATDWTISDDGMVYTFNLRENLKFSDGRDVKPEDWEWSFYRARDTETSSYAFIAKDIETVEATDETVTITLKQPSASFLANLCNFNMVLGCKAYHEEMGEEAYIMNPLGTGPYLLKEWQKENFLVLEANPHYWDAGFPKTKQLKYTVVGDDNTRLMQLQAGQIDVVNDLPFSLVDQAKSKEGILVKKFPSTQVRYTVFNTTKEPFDDVNVRKAVVMAIDKQEISDLVAGEYGKVANNHVPEAEGDWVNPDLKVVEYNPEEAKKLLEEAGHPNLKFTMTVRAGAEIYEQMATMMQAQLKAAGVDMEIEKLERASATDKFVTLNHQMTLLQWSDDIPDPAGVVGFAVEFDQSKGWYTGLHDTKLEELSRKASVEMDYETRKQMYWDIEQGIYDNFNVVPIFSNDFLYATSDKVDDLRVTPFNVVLMKYITMTK